MDFLIISLANFIETIENFVVTHVHGIDQLSRGGFQCDVFCGYAKCGEHGRCLEKKKNLQQDVHKFGCVLTWLWDFLKYGQGHDKVGIDSLYQQKCNMNENRARDHVIGRMHRFLWHLDDGRCVLEPDLSIVLNMKWGLLDLSWLGLVKCGQGQKL